MPQVPDVLRHLKALGLNQKAIAAYIGASPAAVSMWATGKNPLAEPWRTEAAVLLAVLREHLAHGKTLDTFAYPPALSLTPSGEPVLVGFLPNLWDNLDAFRRLDVELKGQPQDIRTAAQSVLHSKLAAEQLAAWLRPVDPVTWRPTATELHTIRGVLAMLRIATDSLTRHVTQTLLKEATDADQTA